MKTSLFLIGAVLVVVALAGVATGWDNIPGNPAGVNNLEIITVVPGQYWFKIQDIVMLTAGVGLIALSFGSK